MTGVSTLDFEAVRVCVGRYARVLAIVGRVRFLMTNNHCVGITAWSIRVRTSKRRAARPTKCNLVLSQIHEPKIDASVLIVWSAILFAVDGTHNLSLLAAKEAAARDVELFSHAES